MNYGHFDDAAREYVITNPRTPVKWINYIGTLSFGGFVDHTGGALICKGDPALNRITRYMAHQPASEFKGEGLYLRIRQPGGYRVFSPFWVPTLDPFDRFECHVGLGYSRFVSELGGLRTEITVFVPRDGQCELRDVRITNQTDRPLTVDAVPVVEYTHPNALIQLTNADWTPQTMVGRAVREDTDHVVLLQYPFMRRDSAVNYFTADRTASSFETDRARFLGDHGYGTWARPLSLLSENLSCSEANRGDNIAALLLPLGEIAPGQTVRFCTQLGQAASLQEAMPGVITYRDPAEVDAASNELRDFWDRYLARASVATPDADMNRMLNIHGPRQVSTTLLWSRYLSLYQLGYGARGIGFRDSSQDVMGVLAYAPDEARLLLDKLLRVQLANGSAMHEFNPLTLIANEGDSREMPDRPHYYGDDHLWIVLAATAYLKETGDLSWLETTVPYYDPARSDAAQSGTVLDHLQRAVAFTHDNTGTHGLPLLGFADWNDTVNLPAGAESMFVACLYGRALRELINLARHTGDSDAVSRYTNWYDEIKARFNEVAWDGEWFLRYFDEQGLPLGSKDNPYGQIYANGQSWPVLSGFASPQRARQAMDSLYRRLNTARGIKLSAPPYNGYDPHVGGISTYPPGAKENGGIFLHANPWAIIAETLLGNGDRAYHYYQQINPVAANDRIDEYECEPYVYPQNILGDDHAQFGLARNSWLTGTASWAQQAATQHILGIRPAYDGLVIDPCIPSAWEGFRARRLFRGTVYHIEIRNPHHLSHGVSQLYLNHRRVSGNVLPAARHHRHCHVLAILGPHENHPE